MSETASETSAGRMAQDSMPNWVKYAIGWHVYPLGFVGAPQQQTELDAGQNTRAKADANHASILRLLPWLDYMQELGVNVLQLAPVFQSSTHGYDTLDFYRIDQRLGTEDDLRHLIDAAHQRGVKVLFDGVFNHIGADSEIFHRALKQPDSSEARLFSIDREAVESGDRPVAPCFEGHESLIEFDHQSPETVDFVADVMNYWNARGVDGWRLDAAYAVNPTFWAQVLPKVRENYPDSFIYGEVIHGDYPAIVAQSQMSSVTEYELWKAIWSSLKEANFFELEWTLKRHNGFLESFIPVTFVGNHDVTRIATQVGPQKAALAATILLTVGGVPLIYYGDEQAYTGIKEDRFGGDDQIRPVMPESPEELSDLGAWLKQVYQQLIAVRRRHPWLQSARVDVLSVENEALSYKVIATDNDLVGCDVDESAPELVVDLSLKDNHPTAQVRDGDNVLFRFS